MGVIAVLFAGIWIWRTTSAAPAEQIPSNDGTPVSIGGNSSSVNVPVNPSNPSSGRDTEPTISISGQNGSSFVTKDFIHNGETASDVVNPGNYYLAGSIGYCLADGRCPAGATTTDFNVSYDSNHSSFSILLLEEPLGQSRLHAETFLEEKLGLTEAQLCGLNYWLGTTYWVNEIYAGKNLGFSFCPGATQL